jgi:hypothetical protein
VAGPLVEDLHLPAVAADPDTPLAAPAAPGGEEAGTAVEDELPESRPRNRPERRGARRPAHRDQVAIHLDLDLVPGDADDVLHDARSSTATVSTCAVWGKRSNAVAAASR